MKLSNVSHSFGSNQVLADITLAVKPAQHIVLLGANASGKSTLGLIASGLLRPTQGEVTFPDTGESINVGIVFQDPDDQIVSSTVMDEVAFGPANLGLPRNVVWQRVEEALELVQLTHKQDAATNELSGGEKQRLALAGVLALHPRFLVADEVGSMLDSSMKLHMRKIFTALSEKNVGVLNITHDLLDILEADYVVVLHDTRIAWEGEPLDALEQLPRFKKWGIAVSPYIELLSALRKQDAAFIPSANPQIAAQRAHKLGLQVGDVL